MPASNAVWRPVGADSPLERGPSTLPVVAHRDGHLELLPFDALTWPDFESLQWRVLRDVEGLRHAQMYGDPGQAQLGLDIVAVAADGTGVALQSKRVDQFGPAKITGAVDAFRNTSRPFSVSRFVIGVSREVRTRQAIDRFKKHRDELRPVEFELWDQRELSRKLKGAPEIVIEYFGMDVAQIFCAPFVISPRVVPDRDVVAVREALARTPEVTTGAGDMISRAQDCSDDPAAALALVEQAQDALTAAGFAGHAAQHEALRASLLVSLSRGAEATRRRLDQVWLALEQGHTVSADIASREIAAIASTSGAKETLAHDAIARVAVHLYENPLAEVPNLSELKIGDISDRARLAAMAGETALASNDLVWLKRNAVRMRNLAAKVSESDETLALATRLRLLAAEGSGNWASVLADARTLTLGYAVGALVQARHARYLALNQKFEEADAGWAEAAGSACLAERWTDASRWVFCRRAFRGRWRPFTSDELLPTQTALAARGPDQTVLTRDEDALEYGYARLADDKLRAAAIAAQRALRDAVTLCDWEGERRARRLLADVLKASGEYQSAARHLVLAGDVAALKRLGTDRATEFLDVTAYLDATPWWIAGAAYALLSTQADLIPDDLVSIVGSHVLTELAAAANGKLIDLPGFAGSRYLGAIAVVAGLAERLEQPQAEAVLRYFEAQPDVDVNHYRFQDEDEARAVTGFLASHDSLGERALRHLVLLLARSEVSRKSSAIQAVVDGFDLAEPLLRELSAEGSSWADEMLGMERPQEASDNQAEDARARLETPLQHTPGVFGSGASARAGSDVALMRHLPATQQQAALEQLVARGRDPMVSSADRARFLVAASELRPPSDKKLRSDLFEDVLGLVLAPPASVADAVDDKFQHPLGAMRTRLRRDIRGEAAHLAAALARTKADKARVRALTLGLVGDSSVSEYWVTRALQRLGDVVALDVGFLSGQDWALKSLAAILWSKSTEPAPVGLRLAADSDVRVRRALATHLVENQIESNSATAMVAPDSSDHRAIVRDQLLKLLRQDPCYSVRKAATMPTPAD